MNRAWKICSNSTTRNEEINKIKAILLNNEYPKSIIESEISKFLKNRQDKEKAASSETSTEVITEEKKTKRFITLPYINDQVEKFSNRLTRLVNANFPKVDLKVAYKAPKEIGNCFHFKDRQTDVLKQSLVIYHIKCKDCKADFIGKTERFQFHRVQEHKGELSNKTDSAIHQHQLSTSHNIDFDNVRIIDRAESDFKLQFKEILQID